jgi:hypothetical protein
MPNIADIEGIWIADNQTPFEECGCLVGDLKRKPGAPQKQFALKNNVDFKLVGWVKGNMPGRRVFLRGELTKTFQTGSKSPLNMSPPVDITGKNKGVPQPVKWMWPRADNWKIPGEYAARIALGHIEGPNSQVEPEWDEPVTFTFEVVNK